MCGLYSEVGYFNLYYDYHVASNGNLVLIVLFMVSYYKIPWVIL
jgi:hypothetical protein